MRWLIEVDPNPPAGFCVARIGMWYHVQHIESGEGRWFWLLSSEVLNCFVESFSFERGSLKNS